MSLSNRERVVVLLALLVVGAFLADRIVLSPLWARYQADAARADAAGQELHRVRQLLNRRPQLRAKWEQRVQAGLNEPVSRAESNLLNALEGWARQTSVSISAMRPERTTPKNGLQVVQCRLTVVGRMRSLTEYCWHLENAAIPMKIERLQLSAGDATRDSATAQLQISTVCLAEKEGTQP